MTAMVDRASNQVFDGVAVGGFTAPGSGGVGNPFLLPFWDFEKAQVDGAL